MSDDEFFIEKHKKLLVKCLQILPSAYAGFQNSRPTVLFFLISSLDLLNKLDTEIKDRKKVIKWVYDLLIDFKSGFPESHYGFRGSLFLDHNNVNDSWKLLKYESAHIAQTYTALCCLLILGDDLSRLDSHSILRGIQLCQTGDGSFCAFGSQNSESDMRFVFCAVAICFILNDFSYIDIDKIKKFIAVSVNYDGGIGQGPCCESHGGSTYCAIASLYMLGHLWDYTVLSRFQLERLKNWAILKQEEGFHGRTNKPDDSCYAFWIGATLSMLNSQYLVDEVTVRRFLMHTQDDLIGGFSKYEDCTSDILHTYFSIAALSIFEEPLLAPVFAPLNISRRAYEHLLRIRNRNS